MHSMFLSGDLNQIKTYCRKKNILYQPLFNITKEMIDIKKFEN